MRYATAVYAALLVAAGGPMTVAQTRDAAVVLTETRQALGGEKNLGAVRTLTLTGRTRRLQGENLVPVEFEINIALPDKYVRRDEIPAQESGPTSRGFSGSGLIQLPLPSQAPARAGGPASRSTGAAPARAAGPNASASPPAPAGGPAPERGGPPPVGPDRAGGPAAFAAPKSDPLSVVRQDFSRLALGMFAASFDVYPLTFTRIGEAEAPQGKADVIEVKGPEGSNFAVRWFISQQSHLPIMISWQMPATSVIVTVPDQPKPTNLAPGTVVVVGPPVPAATASKEEVDTFTKTVADLRRKAQTTLLEHRLYYADYRDVGGGLHWPFRLRRAIGADTVEETNIDEFRINPKIDPRRFEVAK